MIISVSAKDQYQTCLNAKEMEPFHLLLYIQSDRVLSAVSVTVQVLYLALSEAETLQSVNRFQESIHGCRFLQDRSPGN